MPGIGHNGARQSFYLEIASGVEGVFTIAVPVPGFPSMETLKRSPFRSVPCRIEVSTLFLMLSICFLTSSSPIIPIMESIAAFRTPWKDYWYLHSSCAGDAFGTIAFVAGGVLPETLGCADEVGSEGEMVPVQDGRRFEMV
jgi:hypothetical protein